MFLWRIAAAAADDLIILMERFMLKHLVIAAALSTPSLAAFAEDIVIPVESSPLEISYFKSEYSKGSGSYPRPEISYRVQLENKTEQDVVAVGIGLVTFGAFNEQLGRGFTGISITTIKPNSKSGGLVWTDSPLGAFQFEKFGTAIAYVKQARMADGAIWRADMSQVLWELQKIESSLTLEDLEPAPGGTNP